MATLIFSNKGLQSVLQLTLQATVYQASLVQAIQAYEKDTGLAYQFDKNIDLTPYQFVKHPTLWLVKDQGIYLMTSAQLETIPADESHICYAEGFSPNDPDWYEKCREAVGADDFSETIPFDQPIQRAIRQGAGISIEVTAENLTIQLIYHR